jgi:chemotaxis protein methyltransferase CheR
MSAAIRDNPAYPAVLKLLHTRTGLTFSSHRQRFAEAGIQRAMAKAGVGEAEDYLERLRSGKLSFDDLVTEVTVGETYFFRDVAQLDFIREEVLPELRRLRGAGHVLKAWSAGCASGEEAYSLAILFEEERLARNSSILATDISRTALTKARAGVYGAWSFRGDTRAVADRYFQRKGSRFAIASRFRERIEVDFLNLAIDVYPSIATGTAAMDLILCRNVLIYFDAETIERVAKSLFESLGEGGWLITGPSDPHLQGHAQFETVVTTSGVFYRRRSRARSLLAVATPAPSLPVRQRVPAATKGKRLPEAYPSGGAPGPTLASRSPGIGTDDVDGVQDAFIRGDYERVVNLTTGSRRDAATQALRVRALANLGDPLRAERFAAKATVAHPTSPELHFLHGIILVQVGRYEQAARAIRRVIYLDRSLAVAHLTLGSILLQLKEPDEARRAFRNGRDLALGLPAEKIVPLSDGAHAGHLVEAAKAQIELLGSRRDFA